MGRTTINIKDHGVDEELVIRAIQKALGSTQEQIDECNKQAAKNQKNDKNKSSDME